MQGWRHRSVESGFSVGLGVVYTKTRPRKLITLPGPHDGAAARTATAVRELTTRSMLLVAGI